MIQNLIISILSILALLAGWIIVQHLSRSYAAKHPEFGPAKEEGGSCFFCLCKDRDHCPKRNKGHETPPISPPKRTKGDH